MEHASCNLMDIECNEVIASNIVGLNSGKTLNTFYSVSEESQALFKNKSYRVVK